MAETLRPRSPAEQAAWHEGYDYGLKMGAGSEPPVAGETWAETQARRQRNLAGRPESPSPAPLRSGPAYLGSPHDSPIWQELADELDRAMTKFGPMASPHEGWAVIREELDPELWAHVVGMAIRYMLDLCEPPR